MRSLLADPTHIALQAHIDQLCAEWRYHLEQTGSSSWGTGSRQLAPCSQGGRLPAEGVLHADVNTANALGRTARRNDTAPVTHDEGGIETCAP